ncbi:alanine acetyltransferase [Vulcanibacillus modesticaldus]|uniref:Alanine acetyltransferase n=1 Tax=Vulcanibacillus modesticaldus TaxID=337097 RepID=A0A1D2YW83_9BACI|nr:ribosomal protein S5-alanine N-acetyltransferase [Vulcanibacillus modesticaldus]OEF99906.1 alanine acetyltransferase [Vulcanibacillus modesticaldus]
MAENNRKTQPVLYSERTILRMPRIEDIPAILDFYHTNRAYLAPFEPIRPDEFYTEEFWRKDILQRHEEFNSDRSLRMFIFDKAEPGKVIGSVNFNQIVRGVFHACYLGYNLAENMQGKGLMTEALTVAIDYVFNDLNLHRIMANYMPHNRRSGNVLKRLGFTIEGYAQNYLYINGRWEDHILTSLTNHKWVSKI